MNGGLVARLRGPAAAAASSVGMSPVPIASVAQLTEYDHVDEAALKAVEQQEDQEAMLADAADWWGFTAARVAGSDSRAGRQHDAAPHAGDHSAVGRLEALIVVYSQRVLKLACASCSLLTSGSKGALARRFAVYAHRERLDEAAIRRLLGDIAGSPDTEIALPPVQAHRSHVSPRLTWGKYVRQSTPAHALCALSHVTLLVDSRERGAGSGEGFSHVVQSAAAQLNIAVRCLAIGDMLFIARCRGAELVLPIVIERKEANDLVKSVVDARYGLQKAVLRWGYAGAPNTARAIYLVEDFKVGQPTSSERQRVDSACWSTAIKDRMTVVRSCSQRATASWLAAFAAQLGGVVKQCDSATDVALAIAAHLGTVPVERLLTFDEWGDGVSRRRDALLTATLLPRMLRRVRGCSHTVAFDVARHCKTLEELCRRLEQQRRTAGDSDAVVADLAGSQTRLVRGASLVIARILTSASYRA